MTSPVDIVNIALMEIGHQEVITSFTEGSPTANVANQLYQTKINALFRSANWNCARKQAALTLLRAVTINGVATNDNPPLPWYYEYSYPSDCLRARYIIPYDLGIAATTPPLTTFQNASPYLQPLTAAVPFIIGNDGYPTSAPVPTRVILTNMANAVLVYTFQVDDPTQWDPQFIAAATSFLGAWFVNALGRNRALANDQANSAQAIINAARVSDGNEGPTSADHLPDWMRARGIYTLPDNMFANTWDQIAFPGGIVF